ncbi:MAG: hypothetical protein ACRDRZ_17655 [Pseudonocardiaceae bacterium]
MDGYLLQIQQMGVLIDNLTDAAENISSANDKLEDASPNELGSHAIDQAGRAFQDRWEHGTEKIAEATEGMVEGLQQTQRDYQRIEDEISRLFPSGGAGVAAGTASGAAPAANPDSAISTALDGGAS